MNYVWLEVCLKVNVIMNKINHLRNTLDWLKTTNNLKIRSYEWTAVNLFFWFNISFQFESINLITEQKRPSHTLFFMGFFDIQYKWNYKYDQNIVIYRFVFFMFLDTVN